MNYWWVNQNQTYKDEFKGGFLWSPKTTKDGKRNQFYDNMELVESGDLIFSFVDTLIQAVGVATGIAQTTNKPDFGTKGDNWSKEGWLVPVEFTELKIKPRPKDFISELHPYLPKKYSPMQLTGDGNQGVYLALISKEFANILLEKADVSLSNFSAILVNDQIVIEETERKAVEGRTDIGPTQKLQLIQSHRGQGIFRTNVRLNETRCRITGVSNPNFLIASHIKLWSVSNDKEKLDGNNGLLLSPHIDNLFDKGWISFQNNGDILISKFFDEYILNQWNLIQVINVGTFSSKQSVYLEYHRTNRFKK